MSSTTTNTVNTTSKGITNDYYLNTSKYNYTTSSDNSTLGKDAFLQILIAQLQNQDPTSPMDDKEFIAQMAQFSSLEQMQNMTKVMEDLLQSQQETQLMSYTSFIGKEVKWHAERLDEEGKPVVDEGGKPIVDEGKGTINELKFVDGSPVFILDDGKEISSGNISSVLAGKGTASSTNPFVTASELIGKMVKYSKDNQVTQAIIEAITTKNGVIEYILNNGTRLTKDQFELVSESNDSKTEGSNQK